MRNTCVCGKKLNKGTLLCPKCQKAKTELERLIGAHKGQITGYLIGIKIARERISYLEEQVKEMELKILHLRETKNEWENE